MDGIVTVSIRLGEEDEEPEEGEPACNIGIGYAEGLPTLALALGLLEPLTSKQQRPF